MKKWSNCHQLLSPFLYDAIDNSLELIAQQNLLHGIYPYSNSPLRRETTVWKHKKVHFKDMLTHGKTSSPMWNSRLEKSTWTDRTRVQQTNHQQERAQRNNIQVNFINKFKISYYNWRKGIMSRNSLALQNIESNLERWNSLSSADINDEIEGDAPDDTELSKFPGILETLKRACPMALDLRKISTPFSKLERTIETAGFIRHEMMECIERSNRGMPRARQESGAMWR